MNATEVTKRAIELLYFENKSEIFTDLKEINNKLCTITIRAKDSDSYYIFRKKFIEMVEMQVGKRLALDYAVLEEQYSIMLYIYLNDF